MGDIPVAAEFLSIREVLDELVAEFSDITISKIRFLESRGLIHPERTPSGYRKFYSNDVERLRWILRQQRENFLPLKVIKRRLDVEDGKMPDLPDTPSLFDDDCDEPIEADSLAFVVSNIRQVAHPTNDGDPELSEPQKGQAVVNDSVASLHEFNDPVAVKPLLSAVPTPKEVALDAEGGESPPDGHESAKHLNHPSQVEPGDEPSSSSDTPQGPVTEEVSPTATAKSSPATAKSTPATAKSTPATAKSTPAVSSPGSSHRVNDLIGATFSIDELASAASTTVEVIAELEEFGFISSIIVAGVPCFDGDCLTVASMIISLRTFGIEPRHLKSIRHAAERDASLYGQAVAPLLRQRNPDARARAKIQLEELAETGSALYEHILRSELRHLAGG